MATCGYICPACDGKRYNDQGEDCNWCQTVSQKAEPKKQEKESSAEELEKWIRDVHEGPCCSD